jgi:hypothetical protein
MSSVTFALLKWNFGPGGFLGGSALSSLAATTELNQEGKH